MVFIAGVPKKFRTDNIWPDKITFDDIYFYIDDTPSARFDKSKLVQEFSLLGGRPVYAGPSLEQKLNATLPSYLTAMLKEAGRARARNDQVGVEYGHNDDICYFVYGTLTKKYYVENRPDHWLLDLQFNKDATETTVLQTFTTQWFTIPDEREAYIAIDSFNADWKFVYTGLALESKIKELTAIIA